jgi:hypothetical protein
MTSGTKDKSRTVEHLSGWTALGTVGLEAPRAPSTFGRMVLGQPTPADPLLLILGSANRTGSFSAPLITLSSGTGVLGGTNVYGGSGISRPALQG